MPAVSHDIDHVGVSFDDGNAMADAGLLLTGTLVGRLGLERTTDQMCSVGFRPTRKLSTLVSSLVAGGICIDDTGSPRAAVGRSAQDSILAPIADHRGYDTPADRLEALLH